MSSSLSSTSSHKQGDLPPLGAVVTRDVWYDAFRTHYEGVGDVLHIFGRCIFHWDEADALDAPRQLGGRGSG